MGDDESPLARGVSLACHFASGHKGYTRDVPKLLSIPLGARCLRWNGSLDYPGRGPQSDHSNEVLLLTYIVCTYRVQTFA